MMDGSEVKLGDSVYVTAIGSGTVVAVSSDGGFTVKVGNSMFSIRADGYVGNVRKVYWHDPMVIVPPKDLKLWTTFNKMATTNYKMLQELFREGNDGEITATEQA